MILKTVKMSLNRDCYIASNGAEVCLEGLQEHIVLPDPPPEHIWVVLHDRPARDRFLVERTRTYPDIESDWDIIIPGEESLSLVLSTERALDQISRRHGGRTTFWAEIQYK